ncbi:chemotaxis protein CheW [Pseudoduganella namucuonensis]|uniref:Purine-binding chemotaxis protein CheW n=1 Tax=Pseudoduganella namucuonensis TaxID=1035707 RepID=A0A1I7LMJ8_9BURK|nr:chemotaxis protein CheW [Pseudoduganella namucuonensis]SFV10879.1 purine-binding chemotaxis protein CheW [Pseudoduganella namucuonensis]
MTALAHAGRGGAPAVVEDTAQFLTFMLGGEVFAIGILAIKEIIEYSGLTTVPLMPECVRGVINLRGAVVPVMDLAARFGRPATQIGKRTAIVIVEIDADGEQQVVGVMVDAVNAVIDIAHSEIEKAPQFGARIRSEFIAGMGKVNGKFVILLNTDQVLSVSELEAMAQASGAEA